MGELLEMAMIISFGISWPVSVYKSYTSRTATGKSLIFLIFIFLGYICGILSKIVSDSVSYVLFFYVLNTVMVFTDLLLYFRNKKLDRQKAG